MYLPKHFDQTDRSALQQLMHEHALATLVTTGPDGSMDANHVPLLFDAAAGEHGVLRGHVARANPVWREQPDGAPVLAIFHGPQAYVSPSWYPSKAEHGKVVPTWNYAVVHAHGQFRAVDDAAWLRGFLQQLTSRHEAGRTRPWAMSDAPAEFTEQMLKAIVGVEIRVTRLIGKWKVSQNRSAADRAGVVAGLGAEGNTASDAQGMAQLVDRA